MYRIAVYSSTDSTPFEVSPSFTATEHHCSRRLLTHLRSETELSAEPVAPRIGDALRAPGVHQSCRNGSVGEQNAVSTAERDVLNDAPRETWRPRLETDGGVPTSVVPSAEATVSSVLWRR